jgi:hypothetical protein
MYISVYCIQCPCFMINPSCHLVVRPAGVVADRDWGVDAMGDVAGMAVLDAVASAAAGDVPSRS